MHARTLNPRGATLVEGMAAAGILAVGILGAIQTLLAASQQNVIAARLTRASQIAVATRSGLELARYKGLSAPGDLLDPANCTTAPAITALAGGLQALAPPPCILDLDALDVLRVPGTEIVPGYQPADASPLTTTDGDLFRRILVVVAQPGITSLTVVVSFRTGASRTFIRQTTALYDPATNQAGVEL